MNKDNQDRISGNPPRFLWSVALNPPIQDTNRRPIVVKLVRNLREPLQQFSIPGNAPASFKERLETTSSFREGQSASTTKALISKSQRTGSNPVEEFSLQNRFQHDQRTSSVKKFIGSVSQHPRTTSNCCKNQSASTSGASSYPSHETGCNLAERIHLQASTTRALISKSQRTGSNPVEEFSLQNRFQHEERSPSAGKFLVSVLQHPPATESVIENQSTSISRESEDLRRFPELLSHLISPSKREAYELTSPSKKQKVRTPSCSNESQYASRNLESAICTKQETKNLSYPVETLASREKVTAVSLGNKEEEQSSPIKMMPASIEVISECPKQQTDLCPILGLPKSSSPESFLKKSFSKVYKAFQGNEKDVDRLVERLKQFDRFRCVTCGAEFTTQNELLRHEPTHFND